MEHSNSLPPLDALEALLAAARLGSFSAAAEELSITHGAVSRRVAATERWAAVRLFNRHGRGVKLTADGELLAARIEAAIALLQDSHVAGRADRELDTIRISVVPSFARLWLLPRLAQLEGLPVDLRLEVEVEDRHMTLSNARIAIRLGTGNWPDVVSEPLFPERLQPVACRQLASLLGPDPDIAKIVQAPLLYDVSAVNWRRWLGSQNYPHEVAAKDRVFPGYDLTLLAAAAGSGIALARLPYGSDMVDRLDLVPIHSHQAESASCFHVVTTPGKRSATIERLVERLHAAV